VHRRTCPPHAPPSHATAHAEGKSCSYKMQGSPAHIYCRVSAWDYIAVGLLLNKAEDDRLNLDLLPV